jgi:hypothetical protein
VRPAVVYVNLDPAGELTLPELEHAVTDLRAMGCEIIVGDLERLPVTRREVELLISGEDVEDLRRIAEATCAEALSRSKLTAKPKATAICFISRGTVEDALGILSAFGVQTGSDAVRLEGEDIAEVAIDRERLDYATPAKLQTALEAALNREVRFVSVPASSTAIPTI